MKWDEFVTEGQGRFLPTIIEVYERKYPSYFSKSYPICYTSFHDLAIIFTLCSTLFNKKKKNSLHSIRYKEISSVEVSIVKVPTVYLYLLGASLHVRVVLRLKNKQTICLENEDISVLPHLLTLLRRKKIQIVDVMDLQSLLLNHDTIESFYSHIDTHFNSLLEDREKELPK